MKPRFIDANMFLDYTGTDLYAVLKNNDNPSAKVETFLGRVEIRVMSWVDKNTFRVRDWNHLTQFQLGKFRYALLEQAYYMFRNGDIAQDSGYDQEKGLVVDNHAKQEIIICQPCIDFLIQAGLFNSTIKNRRRFMHENPMLYDGSSYLPGPGGSVVPPGGTPVPVPGYYTKEEMDALLTNKVDKQAGMGLSENSFTNSDKTNLSANTRDRHTHNNKAILDATTASFTTELEEKINEGGADNVIEDVKVNNVSLPVVDKAVNIDLTDYATKIGRLPYFGVDSPITTVLSFLSSENTNKAIILRVANKDYIGIFSTAGAEGTYNFEFERVGGKERYVSPDGGLDLTGLTFNDIFSSTYSQVYELDGNKVTSLSSSSTDVQYPSAKLVYDQLALKENLSNKVTSLSLSSTDEQYPSAKCVYDEVKPIKDVIPAQASSENKLADKNFVNSSIATNTAYFKGTFNVVDDLHLTISATHEQVATALASVVSNPTNNDYVFVSYPDATEPTQFTKFERYKYNSEDEEWAFEFELNNSSFTANQWASINSGITAQMVSDMALKSGNNAFSGTNTFDSEKLVVGSSNGLNNKMKITGENSARHWFVGGVGGGAFGLIQNNKTLFKIWEDTGDITFYNSSSKINKNASGYGLILPDTSGFTADKEIATTDQAFKVIYASEIVNNTLTQAQYDLIDAEPRALPVLIKGSVSGNYDTLLCGLEISSQRIRGIAINGSNIHSFYISKSTRKIEFDTANSIVKIKGKTLPDYPSSPTVPQALVYDTDNSLKYVDTPNKNISDAYDNTKTYAVGDTCIYNNVLYKCTTAITTAENFDATHWTATTVAELVADETIVRTNTAQTITGRKIFSENNSVYFGNADSPTRIYQDGQSIKFGSRIQVGIIFPTINKQQDLGNGIGWYWRDLWLYRNIVWEDENSNKQTIAMKDLFNLIAYAKSQGWIS